MKKIFFAIGLISVFFCCTPVEAVDYETYDNKNIADNLEQDRFDTERNRQIMDQVQQDIKDTNDAIKLDRDQSKKIQQDLDEDALRIRRAREEKRRSDLVLVNEQIPVKQDKFFNFISSRPVQIVFFILLIIGLGVGYLYAILSAKKQPTPEEEFALVALKEDFLAAVNQWVFLEKDFKDYQDKFAPLVDAQTLDINSPEFKKYFVKDLSTTEILFQAAIEKDMEHDTELNATLNDYKLYLANLDKKENAFLTALNNYKLSFVYKNGPRMPFVAYYKDFLNLLMLINRQNEAKVIAVYGKILLLDKMVSDASGGTNDAANVQLVIDRTINIFKLEHYVIIKEERDKTRMGTFPGING